MTVTDVLRAARWPLGSGSRTTCPVHGGSNPNSFQYETARWHCHSCNEGGSPEKLARKLLQPAGAIEGLGVPVTPRQSSARVPTRAPARWTGILDRLAHAACGKEWRQAIVAADAARAGWRQAAMIGLPLNDGDLDWVLGHLHRFSAYEEEAIARGARLDAEMSRYRLLTRGARSAY